jgi:light-regulated signal transduction histidine kinase (bacteriophytochrome)
MEFGDFPRPGNETVTRAQNAVVPQGPETQCSQRSGARSDEQRERELQRLATRVADLERERSQLEIFAAMAAHEVLKPLVMTEAYATMLSERMGYALDLDSRRDLDAMVRISTRVRIMVEALLMDARDSQRPLDRQEVDLAEIMRDCVRSLTTEIRSRDANVEIDPMPVVRGEPALLSGVFGNLLANALKYSPRSGGDIRVSAERSEAGWTFAVQSPGPALPEHAREQVFDAWERCPGERRASGAGLGLAIVRHIVERHGGQVGVTSPNEWSNRFFFTLPA